MKMKYKVTYACDSLDTNPAIKEFDCHYEMEEWISDAMTDRIDYVVQHSQYRIDESELKELMEAEWSLVRIENI